MYTTPEDAPLMMLWKEAMGFAGSLGDHGQCDWRLPTRSELHELFKNRGRGALKGTFNESRSGPSGWYWSSTEKPDNPDYASLERFSFGVRFWNWKDVDASVRPVRSGP